MGAHDVHHDDMFDEDPTFAAFARDLQDAAAATPAPAVGASLAAVLEGRAPATVYPDVVETPRARVVRRPARLRWAVAAGALSLGAGSLGVAGALPGPVQRQVARMAEVIGVDVPDGQDDSPTTTTTIPTTTTTSTIATTTSTAPPVGTTVLSGEQDAGEDKPGKPEKPGREDDDDRRGRGRGGNGAEDDPDEDDDNRGRPGSGVDDELQENSGPGSGRGNEERSDPRVGGADPVEDGEGSKGEKSSEQA